MLFLDDEEKDLNEQNNNQDENYESNQDEHIDEVNESDDNNEVQDEQEMNEEVNDDSSNNSTQDDESLNEKETYYDDKQDNRYDSQYNNNENEKSKSNSKKAIWIVASICIVLAIICTICILYISNGIKIYNNISTTSVQETYNRPPKQETKERPSFDTTNAKTSEPLNTEAIVVNLEDFDLEIKDIGGDVLPVKEVYKQVSPSVVIITAYTSSGYGLGSGVVLSEDGYIVTNYHVANPSRTKVIVDFYDGSACEATYVLGDEISDIALIKVDKNNCVPVEIANSDQIEVGDKTIVIGNALGRGITLTSGYISALSRTITIDGVAMTLLQTDATINEGNSGGGLFNEFGQLIGIVNAKSGGTTIEGTGYAIPTNDMVAVINDLQTKGYVTGKARLGITMNLIGSSYSSYNYIQAKEIDAEGSAALAGMQVGDIIYKMDGVEITSTSTLQLLLEKHKVGDRVTLTILRPTKDLKEFAVTSWFGVISYDLSAYLDACEQLTIDLTFVEFNPNN